MPLIGFDTETHPTTRNCIVPPLVCTTWASDLGYSGGEEVPQWLADLLEDYPNETEIQTTGTAWAVLCVGEAAKESCRRAVASTSSFVGQRAAYDMAQIAEVVGVLPVCAMLDQGRITDTDVRERLISIALGDYQIRSKRKGQFSLEYFVKKYCHEDISTWKGGGPDVHWTVSYHLLDGVPLELWPAAAKEYALMDAIWAFRVWAAQNDGPRYVYDLAVDFIHDERDWAAHSDYVQRQAADIVQHGRVVDEIPKVRDSFAIFLQACYGPVVDPVKGQACIDAWDVIYQEGLTIAQEAGFVRKTGAKAGTRDMKALAALVQADFDARGVDPPMTKGGTKPNKKGIIAPPKVSTARDTLLMCQGDVLKAWAEADVYRNYLVKYKKFLLMSGPITYSFNPLVATGRWSVSKPPLHGPPKKGGYREAHVARPGYVYVSTDYNQVELVCLAYVCESKGFGSTMADLIRKGVDLHCAMAVLLFKYLRGEEVTYEEVVARNEAKEEAAVAMRTLAKGANFGFPGGLGIDSFITYVWKNYSVKLSRDNAALVKKAFREMYPDVVRYQQWIGTRTENGRDFTAEQIGSGRFRGGCTYNDGCNTYFQGLAADAIREAIWWITKECFDEASPLYGSRIWLSIHDETLAEVPEIRLHEAATRISDLMLAALSKFVPTIKGKAEPAAMRFWSKDAKTIWKDGKLQVWEGKK